MLLNMTHKWYEGLIPSCNEFFIKRIYAHIYVNKTGCNVPRTWHFQWVNVAYTAVVGSSNQCYRRECADVTYQHVVLDRMSLAWPSPLALCPLPSQWWRHYLVSLLHVTAFRWVRVTYLITYVAKNTKQHLAIYLSLFQISWSNHTCF